MSELQSPSAHVSVEDKDGVAVIRLNRPEKLNALTHEMLAAVATEVRRLGTGDETCGIVITGTGRAFCAGEDLTAVPKLRPGEIANVVALFQDITRALLNAEVPVIAAINGIAVGGAAEMTLACDARVGCAESEYFFPENSLGLTISNGSSILLERAVGSHAIPIVLDGERLSADECHRLGLLHRVVDGEDLIATACRLAAKWGADGTSSRQHLSLLRPRIEAVEAAMEREERAAVDAFDSGVTLAGVNDFLSRRPST